MFLVLCLLLGSPIDDEGLHWKIEDLEIYHFVNPKGQALTTKTGLTFILDYKESIVHRVDANGKLLGSFGGKGEGPGELGRFAGKMDLVQDKIYISGMNNVYVFDLEGTPVNTVKLSPMGIDLTKTTGGWIKVARSHQRGKEPAEDSKLFWVDNNLENERLIAAWPALKRSFEYKDGVMTLGFNPAPDRFLTEFNSDHSIMFYRLPGSDQIHILDCNNGDLLRSITFDAPSLPFNPEWGKKQLEKREKMMSKMKGGFKQKFLPEFPDFFPKIQHMSWSIVGRQLTVSQRSDDEEKNIVRTYDVQGKLTANKAKGSLMHFVLRIVDDRAYLLHYDPEEEMTVLLCLKVEGLESYLQKLHEAAKAAAVESDE